jgi:hypothetical protein
MVVLLGAKANTVCQHSLLPLIHPPPLGPGAGFLPHLLCALAFCLSPPLQSPKPSPGLPYLGVHKSPIGNGLLHGAPGRSGRGYGLFVCWVVLR